MENKSTPSPQASLCWWSPPCWQAWPSGSRATTPTTSSTSCPPATAWWPAAPGRRALQGRGRGQGHAHRVRSAGQRQRADPHRVNEQAPISPTTFAVLGYQGVTGPAHVQLDDAEQPYPELPPAPAACRACRSSPRPFGQLAEQAPRPSWGRSKRPRAASTSCWATATSKSSPRRCPTSAAAAGSVNTLTQRLDATVSPAPGPGPRPHCRPGQRRAPDAAVAAAGGRQRVRPAVDLGKTNQRLNAEGGAIDQITAGTQSPARAADQFSTATLPGEPRRRRHGPRRPPDGPRGRGISDNPQLFIYGSAASRPGRVSPVLVVADEGVSDRAAWAAWAL